MKSSRFQGIPHSLGVEPMHDTPDLAPEVGRRVTEFATSSVSPAAGSNPHELLQRDVGIGVMVRSWAQVSAFPCLAYLRFP